MAGAMSRSRTAAPRQDFAGVLKDLADVHFPGKGIVPVMDNLNTHKLSSLHETFAPEEAFCLAARFEVHHTYVDAPHGHWRTKTFIAAMRVGRIDAPFVLDGPASGDAFRVQVERFPVPTPAPKDVVVVDNLPCHKGTAVRRAIRQAGSHLLFLPPYSPDLNPTEQVFAKPEHLLRNAAGRTAEATWRRIGDLLDRFPPEECTNHFRNSGYASI